LEESEKRLRLSRLLGIICIWVSLPNTPAAKLEVGVDGFAQVTIEVNHEVERR
jgi:hypothetical protein